METAIAIYRERFQPSPNVPKPYLMLGIGVCVAETDDAASRLFTSQQQAVINLRSGRPGLLPPPIDNIDAILDGHGHMILESVLSCAVVGPPVTVRDGLKAFMARHESDEFMVRAQIFDHAARLRSYELLSGITF